MTNPTVTLGGKTYEVPPLVPRQQRIVIPIILKIGNSVVIENGVPQLDSSKITPEFYDDIFAALYWGAIWPNDKTTPITAYLDSPYKFNEIMAAISVIRQQTGLLVPAQEGATPGELKPDKGPSQN